MWAGTYVDLFLSNTDFHTAMFERLQHQPFGDRQIPVLSIEDLLICKVLYDRGKDWVDIEAVAATRQAELDYGYMVGWLSEFIDAVDPRHARLADLKRLRCAPERAASPATHNLVGRLSRGR